MRYELPFYFGGLVTRGVILTGLVGFTEAMFKGVLAGIAALFTFSGTDKDRLFWVAVVFGVCIYAGASLLRLLSMRAKGLPLRWGYFRLAPLLGLMFSAGIAAAGGGRRAAAGKRRRHRLEDHLRAAATAFDRAGERARVPDQAGLRRLHRDGAERWGSTRSWRASSAS